jgi:hypothetical protein
MFIKPGGGKAGIKHYLKFGRKKGNKHTRDQKDKRITLHGDLDLTESIYKSIESDGERYTHFTLSFKESDVTTEELQRASDKFIEFIKADAYTDQEINIYSEAHQPKMKTYKAKNGEILQRKPHIHVIIPQKNLLTGERLLPLGLGKFNTNYTDAFQELYNQKYGYASPKLNPVNKINPKSEVMARKTGVLFNAYKKEKEEILSYIIENNINKYEDFVKYLKSKGHVRTRNKNKENSYLNLKIDSENKGINLKEFFFNKEFIEGYDLQSKNAFINKEIDFAYIEKEKKYKTTLTKKYQEDLKNWKDIRSKEIKYINFKSKFYKEVYKQYSDEQKKEFLNYKEKEFYSKYDIEKEINKEISNIDINSLSIRKRTNSSNKQIDSSVLDSKLEEMELNSFYKNYQGVNPSNQNQTKDNNNAKLIYKKGIDPYGKSNRELYKSVDGAFGGGVKTPNPDDMRTLSEVNMVHNQGSIEMLLQVNELHNLGEKTSPKSYLSMRRANSFNNRASGREIERKRIIFESFFQYLNQIKGVMYETYKPLSNQKILVGRKEYDVKSFLKEIMFFNKQDISLLETKILDLKQRIEKGNEMAIKVNIKQNPNSLKVDYYQLGTQDVAGRYTGIIYDQTSKWRDTDSAKCYVINDKIVDQKVFKEQQSDMFKEIESKQKELFQTKQEERFSHHMRCNIINEKVSLTPSGVTYANSRYNFKELQAIEMGITSFKDGKNLDKNFFTIAKEWLTMKETRDSIKVKYHEFKQNLKAIITSKPELSATNIALVHELSELRAELDRVKTHNEAVQLVDKLQQQELDNQKHVKQTQEQQKEQEQQKDKGFVLGERSNPVIDFTKEEIKDEIKNLITNIQIERAELKGQEQTPEFKNKQQEFMNLQFVKRDGYDAKQIENWANSSVEKGKLSLDDATKFINNCADHAKDLQENKILDELGNFIDDKAREVLYQNFNKSLSEISQANNLAFETINQDSVIESVYNSYEQFSEQLELGDASRKKHNELEQNLNTLSKSIDQSESLSNVASSAIELLENSDIKQGLGETALSRDLTKQIFDMKDQKIIGAANTMISNDLKINGIESVKAFADTLSKASEVAISNGVDFDAMVKNVVKQMQTLQKDKHQDNERGI